MATIRSVTPDDVMQFSGVRLRSICEEPLAFGMSEEEEKAQALEAVAERLRAREDSFVLGAFDSDTLVGTTGLRRMDSQKFRHRAMLWGVYVVPEYRGRGIARLLVGEALNRASGMDGLEIVALKVNAGNESACRLYRSLGFASYGVERRAMKVADRYVDFDCMEIALAERAM